MANGNWGKSDFYQVLKSLNPDARSRAENMAKNGAPLRYIEEFVRDEMLRAAPGSIYAMPVGPIPDTTTYMSGITPVYGTVTTASPQMWVGMDSVVYNNGTFTSADMNQQLTNALQQLQEMTEILENIKKEPLILQRIDRITKDKKHAFIKKGELDLRIVAPPKLVSGDEVLLHPKTFQIVEHLGRPPLEVSRFAPDSVPNVLWSDIGGLEEAKSDLIEAIELPHQNKALFKFYGKKPIKGILLSGPSGCGKTMLGKAAATALSNIYGKEKAHTGFLYIKGPEILNQFVGQTEQTIRDMFFDAKRHREEHGYPAIIFLDEADAILAARGTRNVGIGNTIVPMFLTEMDGLEESGAIVIIATNRPDVLDPAIVRDGRIDRKVTVTRPAKPEGAEILQLNLKNVPLQDDTIVELATKAADIIYADQVLQTIVSGAMLANCVQIAVSQAVRRDIQNKEKKGKGIILDDLVASINRLKKQGAEVQHELEKANANRPELMAVAIMGPPGQPSASDEEETITPSTPTRH